MAAFSHPEFNDLRSNDPTPFRGEKLPRHGYLQLFIRGLHQLTRNILAPLRRWFDGINPHHPWQAHLICRLIPSTCPFERTITVFGYTILHIPALCKLNPLYEEFIALRFRALTYLVDTCNEDISQHI